MRNCGTPSTIYLSNERQNTLMVHLDSITTKTGDAGCTRLGDGTEISKTAQRIEAMGAVDELNSFIGLSCAYGVEEPYFSWLRRIQNDLFDLGADLSIPLNASPDCPQANTISQRPMRLTETKIRQLDSWLEELYQKLPALSSFILPGGSDCSASLHLARSVCRRAEREFLKITPPESVSSESGVYLNRLSDLLFQLARITEDPQNPAPLWKPG